MSSPELEASIYEWFEKAYPGGPQWTSKKFHCYRDAPIELRMIISMDKLEAELANGGLPQLLWNAFFHWRRLLDDCKAGYDMIEAPRHAEAVVEFLHLLPCHEKRCWTYIQRCTEGDDFSWFSKWCEDARPLMPSHGEKLFWSGSLPREERRAWLQASRDRLVSLMKK